LGAAEKIESLEIRWPGGSSEVIKDLAADRFYAILEGKGIVAPDEVRPRKAGH
jgi:hypothetical protein